MAPRWRSSGVATEDDMVSGLAPAKLAETLTVGMSILGSGATGSSVNDPMPASATPTPSRAVAMGRRTKAEIMTGRPLQVPPQPKTPRGAGAGFSRQDEAYLMK